MISEGGLGVAHFRADVASVVEDPWEVLGLDVAPHVRDCLVLEHPAETTDPQGTLACDVHIEIFSACEFWIVVLS